MKKYLYNYIKEVSKNKIAPEDILKHIKWMQHERTIHLVITIFYAILFLLFLALIIVSYVFIIPAAILMIFLIFYLAHYFSLENGVQSLYMLYDKKLKKQQNDNKD